MPKDEHVDMSRARILGTPKDEEVRAGGFPAILMIRGGLDEQNTLKPKEVKKQLQMVQGPDGRPQAVEQVHAVLGREQLCTAEDLVEMMREMVKEEIQVYTSDLIHTITQMPNDTKYGRCLRCGNKGTLYGPICGSCGDDLYQEEKAKEMEPK